MCGGDDGGGDDGDGVVERDRAPISHMYGLEYCAYNLLAYLKSSLQSDNGISLLILQWVDTITLDQEFGGEKKRNSAHTHTHAALNDNTHCRLSRGKKIAKIMIFVTIPWKRKSEHHIILPGNMRLHDIIANNTVLIFAMDEYTLQELWATIAAAARR